MRLVLFTVLFALSLVAVSRADVPAAIETGKTVSKKAADWLVTQQQANGSFAQNERVPPAVTALAIEVLANDPNYGPQHDAVKKGVKFLLSIQQPDGGFYRDMLANYNTAITISALVDLKDPALKEPIERGAKYLKNSQFGANSAGPDGKTLGEESSQVGGWNYGGGRGGADLSNTAVVLDALKDAGLKSDDPAFQNAHKFVTRMQNRSESNPSKWAGNDGGFIYNPGRNGEGMSSAGVETLGDGRQVPRSYGSMTYAGLKSMIYAGLTKDDPRVKAAWEWISSSFSVEENPGMAAAGPDKAKAGIFYYYNTLAKSLDVYDEPVLTDKNGAKHDWRVELIDALVKAQKPDGSFVADCQWMEDNPTIATTLAVLADQDALKDLQEKTK